MSNKQITKITTRHELTESEKAEMLEHFSDERFEYVLVSTEFAPKNLMTTQTMLSNGTRVTYREFSPTSSASKFIIVGYEIIESVDVTNKKADFYTKVSFAQLRGEVRERNKYFKALNSIAKIAIEQAALEEPRFIGYFEILEMLEKAGIVSAKEF